MASIEDASRRGANYEIVPDRVKTTLIKVTTALDIEVSGTTGLTACYRPSNSSYVFTRSDY
jgi:hypothetical protein